MTATAFYRHARIAGGFKLSLSVHIMKTERPIPQQDEIRHSVCVHFGGVEGN